MSGRVRPALGSAVALLPRGRHCRGGPFRERGPAAPVRSPPPRRTRPLSARPPSRGSRCGGKAVRRGGGKAVRSPGANTSRAPLGSRSRDAVRTRGSIVETVPRIPGRFLRVLSEGVRDGSREVRAGGRGESVRASSRHRFRRPGGLESRNVLVPRSRAGPARNTARSPSGWLDRVRDLGPRHPRGAPKKLGSSGRSFPYY